MTRSVARARRLGLARAAVVLTLGSAAGCAQPEKKAEGHEGGPAAPGEPARAGQGRPGMQGMAKGEVMVDPRTQQLMGVTYGKVERRDAVEVIRTVGTVTYDESRLSDVTLKFHGWIEDLFVDQTGILVKQGQRLFTLYSPELVSTQEDYLVAYEHYDRLNGSGDARAAKGAADLLEASRERLSFWDIEPKHLRELEHDRKVLRALPIHAQTGGYVIEKNVVAGSHVQPGQLLYRLANLDEVWILADVYEYELPFVRLGQAAEVSLAYFPGQSFRGRITYIYPYLESKERTVKVRIQLPNPGDRLKVEMYADVALRAHRKGVLTVPRSAVLDSGKRQVVFLAEKEGRFEPREIKLGALLGDYYEVLAGLEEGATVATSSNFLLDSESQLAAGMRQMQH
jgi:membrane fusion protein, copper/silver efflux system